MSIVDNSQNTKLIVFCRFIDQILKSMNNLRTRTSATSALQNPHAVGRSARSLPTLVAERLLQAILEGRLKPGERLQEIFLADEHAVSRATIREALAQLERGHFVERLPRYGARVAEVDTDDIHELYALRAVLLGLASERAARLANDNELQQFDAAVKALEQEAAAGVDAECYTEHVLKVQEALILMAQGKWINLMYESISNQALWHALVRNKGSAFSSVDRRLASARDWRTLANALVRRDSTASENAARALIHASCQFVLQQYKRDHGVSRDKLDYRT
ncbi:GntR family transcriptional regulator [Allopusillimonas soli]|uniref:GntR family transcriptional regulator n=1 Tax=Allopusillimonas soli TaxID=659016 RepID=A0A853F845_9BURK|nr:GntR family transcriptional regulator [Allopusillimonas soli]NYT36273.1 GntR family transcriptional regulator [Allopusillimonas soli]TEA76597.1 GntR family transcriptional regulator [Allopusillimonas soli]